MVIAGIMQFIAGLTGVIYGAGINVAQMVARGASDYTFITAYIIEWALLMISGLALIGVGLRRH